MRRVWVALVVLVAAPPGFVIGYIGGFILAIESDQDPTCDWPCFSRDGTSALIALIPAVLCAALFGYLALRLVSRYVAKPS